MRRWGCWIGSLAGVLGLMVLGALLSLGPSWGGGVLVWSLFGLAILVFVAFNAQREVCPKCGKRTLKDMSHTSYGPRTDTYTVWVKCTNCGYEHSSTTER